MMSSAAWINRYAPAQPNTWQGRVDGGAERYHQVVQCIDWRNQQTLKSPGIAMIGFASDVGIRRNQGRFGAVEGPTALRKQLAALALTRPLSASLYDCGDILCHDGDLETSQIALSELVATVIQQGLTPLILGGGHEVAFGHYLGLAQSPLKNNLGIINIDAHLDVRACLADNKGTSGSSFLQIAHHRQKNQLPFHYLCVGLQPAANTIALWNTAKQIGAITILAEEMRANINYLTTVKQFIAQCSAIYLTLCMDVFAQAYAPGVSAPQALGLTPAEVLPILRLIIGSKKVCSMDIAELSPRWDCDQQTARLAAVLAAEFIQK